MLAIPMKPIAASAIKLSEDENISTPMRHCTEKNVAKAPENISITTRYLRIEAKISKTWKRSLRVVSTTKLSTSIVGGSQLMYDFLRLSRI
jgi:hypothetical protein